jgi:hypothetical protein
MPLVTPARRLEEAAKQQAAYGSQAGEGCEEGDGEVKRNLRSDHKVVWLLPEVEAVPFPN